MVIWVVAKGANWFVPLRGDPAPEFEVIGGNAEQNVLFGALLLQAEFMHIKADLVLGAVTVERLLQTWNTELKKPKKR